MRPSPGAGRILPRTRMCGYRKHGSHEGTWCTTEANKMTTLTEDGWLPRNSEGQCSSRPLVTPGPSKNDCILVHTCHLLQTLEEWRIRARSLWLSARTASFFPARSALAGDAAPGTTTRTPWGEWPEHQNRRPAAASRSCGLGYPALPPRHDLPCDHARTHPRTVIEWAQSARRPQLLSLSRRSRLAPRCAELWDTRLQGMSWRVLPTLAPNTHTSVGDQGAAGHSAHTPHPWSPSSSALFPSLCGAP